MKLALFLVLALGSQLAYAQGPLSNVQLPVESCPGLSVANRGYQLECQSSFNFATVKSAKVGENIKDLRAIGIKNLDWYGAVELGVLPDPDTSIVYAYNRKLLDRNDKVVGIMSIEMYVNNEMDVRVKLVSRYNIKGKLVSARVEELE